MMMMMMMMIIQFQVDIKEVMWKHNSRVIVQGLYTFAVYNWPDFVTENCLITGLL